jgi:hypothetical protein
MRTKTTPYQKIRRILTVIIFIWFFGDTILQTLFFANLSPLVITSCCAVVFDPTTNFLENPAGFLSVHPKPILFYIVSVIFLGVGIVSRLTRGGALKLIYGWGAPAFFFFCIAAMTSFISPYIYALPNHHCPFCILTGKEATFGIPMMLSVFLGGLCGWASGVVKWACEYRYESTDMDECSDTLRSQRRYQLISLFGFMIFVFGGAAIVILYKIFGELL